MVTVTDNARKHLKKTLLAHSSDPNVGIRLELKPPGQLGLVLSEEVEGDQVVEEEGSKVLLVGSETAEMLEGVTIDVQDAPDGLKLVALKGE